MAVMRVLYLTLKKEWFDMIRDGVKTEEYREVKPYWEKRLAGKEYDAIQFRNGYSPKSPTMLVKLKAISVGTGYAPWGAPKEDVFNLFLGPVLSA